MKDLLLGQEPAFASFQGEQYSTQQGMSKRFYAACAAMQGLLPIIKEKGRFVIDGKPLTPQNIAAAAYLYADELLKQETKIEQHDNN